MKPSVKRITGFAMIAAAALTAIAPITGQSQGTPKELGYVSAIKGSGKSFILRKKSKILIVGMDVIKKEDTVEIPNNARLIVNLAPGAAYEVTGPAQFIVKNDGPQFVSGAAAKKAALDGKLFKSVMDELLDNGRYAYDIAYTGGTLNKSKSQKYGSMTVRGSADKLTLRTGILLPWRPFLYWDKVPGASGYRVTIKKDETMVCEIAAANCSIAAIPQCGSLKAGDYTAFIEALGKDDSLLKKGEGDFSVSTDKAAFDAKEKAVKDMTVAMPEAAVLLGRFYEKYDLIPEALIQYRMAYEIDTDNTGLKEKIDFLAELIQ